MSNHDWETMAVILAWILITKLININLSAGMQAGRHEQGQATQLVLYNNIEP